MTKPGNKIKLTRTTQLYINEKITMNLKEKQKPRK